MQVLRAAGLRSEVSSEVFLECVRAVASWRDDLQSHDPSRRDYVWDTALELGRHYTHNAASLHAAGIYAQLRSLPSFPAVQVSDCSDMRMPVK